MRRLIPALCGAALIAFLAAGAVAQTPFIIRNDTTNNNLSIGIASLPAPLPAAKQNVAVGNNTLTNCTTCNLFTALGFEAGQNETDGRSGVFIGFSAGQYAKDDSSSTFIGGFTGRGSFDGPTALLPQLAGSGNSCGGEAACIAIYGAASLNTAWGYAALYGLGTGNNNDCFGGYACEFLTTQGSISAFGDGAYRYGQGSGISVFGAEAGLGVSQTATVSTDSPQGGYIIYTAGTTLFAVGDQIFTSVTPIPTTVASINPGSSITVSTLLAATLPAASTVTDLPNIHTGRDIALFGTYGG